MHQNLPQQQPLHGSAVSCFCLVKDFERGREQGESPSHHGAPWVSIRTSLSDDLGGIPICRNLHLSGYQDPGGLMGHDNGS